MDEKEAEARPVMGTIFLVSGSMNKSQESKVFWRAPEIYLRYETRQKSGRLQI